MKKDLEKTYNPHDIEERTYQKWIDKKYFHAEVDRSKKPFTIVMPPPNITGKLHMGHALDNTMQDILTRYKRMQGYNALWVPATDHASISTEVKVIDQLKKEGIELPPQLFDLTTLQQMAIAGQFTGSSLVWKSGMPAWVAAETVDELKEVLANAMPPIPQ